MVNVFEYERSGFAFNNADSAHAVGGGDYEAGRFAAKRNRGNTVSANEPSIKADGHKLPHCPKCGALELGDECDMCGTEMPTA